MKYNKLTEEKNIMRDKFFFNLSRKYAWGKELRWNLEKLQTFYSRNGKLITRTNASRPPAVPLKMFENFSEKHTDSIQEYFIPLNNFNSFILDLKKILLKNKKQRWFSKKRELRQKILLEKQKV